jgi:DNA-binding transcriptional regulator YiaG
MKSLSERLVREMTEVPVHIPTADGSGIAETIKVRVAASRDPKTGELFLDGEALEAIDKAKARYMGLLSPSDIKALRQGFGLSQREMSELIKIGEKTYTRWESGRERPSQSLNLILCALRDGRLTVGYLRSVHQMKFNWQHVVAPESHLEKPVEPITIHIVGQAVLTAAKKVQPQPRLAKRTESMTTETKEKPAEMPSNEEFALAA